MVQNTIDVFMDDFLVVGDSFGRCLHYLTEALKRSEDCPLVLIREKCNFMVKNAQCWGIVFSKKVLRLKELNLRKCESFSHLSQLKVREVFLGMRVSCGGS